ncbi:LuxR C-terminal-related transcriptional regulator [Kitasatospora sp. NBC_00315]|uniref:LuxR C-terminal-related transcriptional regulator n=1 Tax=Kitasatospora sp. NBC_00315 TaxID=2975963 RepID=UPI0032472BB7
MATPPTAERPAEHPADDAARRRAQAQAPGQAPNEAGTPTGAPTGAPTKKKARGRTRGRSREQPQDGTGARTAVSAQEADGRTRAPERPPAPKDLRADAARLLARLTPREVQVLTRLAAGDDMAQLAAALGIAPATARTHLHRTMRKLGVRTREEAAGLALTLLDTGAPAPDRHRPVRRPTAAPTAESGPAAAPAPGTLAPGAAPAGTTARGVEPPGTKPSTTAAPRTDRARTDPPTAAGPTDPPRTDPPTAPAPAGRRTPAAPADTPPGFEQLYEGAYARLVQQVFLLTAYRHRTLHCVNRAFGAALRAWPEVSALPDPESWVRIRACEGALSPWHHAGRRRAEAWRFPLRRTPVRPADEGQAVLPGHDRLSDQDKALLKALRRLSRPQRRALVLHDGIGLPAAVVAVETESTTGATEERVWAARAALADALPELLGADPTEPGFPDRLSAVLYRAGVRGYPEPERPPVPVLSTRYRVRTATLTGGAALVTVAMGTAIATTLVGTGPAALFRPPAPVPHPVCTNAATGSAGPAAPGGIPPGLRTIWCSAVPGRAAVLGPPPVVTALWGPARHDPWTSADALGPPLPTPAAVPCTVWAPRPCGSRAQAPPPPVPPLWVR